MLYLVYLIKTCFGKQKQMMLSCAMLHDKIQCVIIQYVFRLLTLLSCCLERFVISLLPYYSVSSTHERCDGPTLVMPLPHSLSQLSMVPLPYLGDLPTSAVGGHLWVVLMLLVLCPLALSLLISCPHGDIRLPFRLLDQWWSVHVQSISTLTSHSTLFKLAPAVMRLDPP